MEKKESAPKQKPGPKPKGRKFASYRHEETVLNLRNALAKKLKVKKSAVVDIAIRELAEKHGIADSPPTP